MVKKYKGYNETSFPKARLPVVDSLKQSRYMDTVHSLMEADVTEARRLIKESRNRTGEPLSFTAFLTYCLSRAVDEHKSVHAYRRGNKLVIYDEVDICVVVEREISGVRAPIFPHVVKSANTKTLANIHQEIRTAQSSESHTEDRGRLIDLYSWLPGFTRHMMWRIILRSPRWRKRLTGTVGISAIGMFGKGAGWGIPIPTFTMSLTVGGITEKPGVVQGRIEPREYLNLTLSFDHAVVDGAPAARFTQRLKELIEGGHGLIE
ncbi:2-oxo acid dehydrogenase subunit E2 [Chloroflexota bacterium]